MPKKNDRQKPDTLAHIADFNEADEALKELAFIMGKLDAIDKNMNERIAGIKSKAVADAAPIKTRKKALETALEAFGKYNKSLFELKRSKELMYGTLGFRKATKLKPVPKTTWAQILVDVIEKNIIKALKIKKALNKEELETWTDEDLGKISVRRVEVDGFWFEVERETVKS